MTDRPALDVSRIRQALEKKTPTKPCEYAQCVWPVCREKWEAYPLCSISDREKAAIYREWLTQLLAAVELPKLQQAHSWLQIGTEAVCGGCGAYWKGDGAPVGPCSKDADATITALRAELEATEEVNSTLVLTVNNQASRLVAAERDAAALKAQVEQLRQFCERERALIEARGKGGQSVGYSPSITPSVLKALERILAAPTPRTPLPLPVSPRPEPPLDVTAPGPSQQPGPTPRAPRPEDV